jgi:hypothetical protein
MNDNILYHLVDLDIRAILQEEADHLIETIDLPKTQVIELTNNESEDLLNTEPITLEPKTQELESEIESELESDKLYNIL